MVEMSLKPDGPTALPNVCLCGMRPIGSSWRYIVVTAENGAMVPCRCFLRQADLTVDVVAVAVVREFLPTILCGKVS